MIYIQSPSTDPHFNLALEQYVFDEMDKNQSYVMLWQNDKAIIIGKHQNTIQEINTKYVKEHQISVVRRLSGGGAVYHDLGNLNFTFIVSENGLEQFDFGTFCQPVVQALQSLGVAATLHGRNDMTIAGKKFSGNAQYAKHGRVMHHGTILFDSDLTVMQKALQVSEDKITSKGVCSVKSRVTNVKPYLKTDISLIDFKKIFLGKLQEQQKIKTHTFTQQQLQEIETIQKQRYDTWEWNYGASPQYDIVKHRRIENCGTFDVHMNVKDGHITAFDIFGDYFGNGNKADLQKILQGVALEEKTLQQALQNITLTEYFHNMTNHDFISLLLL